MIDRLVQHVKTHPTILLITCLGLILLAYFVDLGYNPIMADEPTRAVVAMEMMFSDNYIVPTINGELYYNKPPFYNWILVGTFWLTGSFSEGVLRLPSVIPLMLFGLTIWAVTRHYVGDKEGLYAGIMYVTCGRMLIYSGLLGHIDIFYSLLTFLGFIAVWHYYQRDQLLWLFVITYLITAIGFLCKGLPSVVFQGITLLTFFIYQKKWKQLFSWQHLVGGLVFILLVGGYYLTYFQFNPDVEGYFANLWNESSKRTVLEKSWYESLLHPLLFPFEQIMHLLPWSLLGVFLIRKGMWRNIMEHPFLKFSIYILFFNSIIYVLSPQTYPRYLFMLYPFVFIFIAYGYEKNRYQVPRLNQGIEYFFLGISTLIAVGVWVVLYVELLDPIPYRLVKVIGLFIAFIAVIYLYVRIPSQRFILFVMVMMLFRLGFNWFVLPHRYETDQWRPMKDIGMDIASLTEEASLYVFPDFYFDHYYTYYIERERKEILSRTDSIHDEAFYICHDDQLLGRTYDLHYEFISRQGYPLNLVTFKK